MIIVNDNVVVGNSPSESSPRILSDAERERRRSVCLRCPIYSAEWGTCDSRKWIDPKTGAVSAAHRPGYVRGCGCLVDYKTRGVDNSCVAGKW